MCILVVGDFLKIFGMICYIFNVIGCIYVFDF